MDNLKVTRTRIVTQRRDTMKALGVRGKLPGYSTYLDIQQIRFNGKASAAGDRQLIAEAKRTQEPDWTQLSLAELQAAERMALHRLSGGEACWRPVLTRVRDAMMAVIKRESKARRRVG